MPTESCACCGDFLREVNRRHDAGCNMTSIFYECDSCESMYEKRLEPDIDFEVLLALGRPTNYSEEDIFHCGCGHGDLREFARTPYEWTSIEPYVDHPYWNDVYLKCDSCDTIYEADGRRLSGEFTLKKPLKYDGILDEYEIREEAPKGWVFLEDANLGKVVNEAINAARQKGAPLTRREQFGILRGLGYSKARLEELERENQSKFKPGDDFLTFMLAEEVETVNEDFEYFFVHRDIDFRSGCLESMGYGLGAAKSRARSSAGSYNPGASGSHTSSHATGPAPNHSRNTAANKTRKSNARRF